MKEWLKLDNAAKIFPSVSNNNGTNLYGLSFVLKEEINPAILEEAVAVALERFPYFKVRIKRGLFWFYLDENKNSVPIKQENPFLLELINKIDTRGFLFRISYFNCKISLEVFHAMTDGFGAMQFMKSIVHAYLAMTGKDIKNEYRSVLTDVETIREEFEDSFLKNYDKDIKVKSRTMRALHFNAEKYSDNWVSIVIGIANENDVKEVLKKYDCSVTQLLVSTIMYSAMQNRDLFEKKNYPFQVIVPVNLRRFFPSKTLRNFSLVVGTKINFNDENSFEQIIQIVKEELANELTKEKLSQQITANVRIEKMFVMRIVPLFIKKIALKIGYRLIGTKPNSFCISNLGRIDIPDDMKKHVDQIIFSNGVLKNVPINLGVTNYDEKIFMTFSSTLVERKIQRDFFKKLSSLGIRITVETNELEV